MYWSDFLRVLLRRWYVVVPSLMLTFLIADAAFIAVPATYRASTSIVLLPPTSGTPPQQATANRFAALPLTAISTLLADALATNDVDERLRRLGLKGNHSATATQNEAPVVVLTAEDHHPSLVTRRLSTLVDLANQQLQSWQSPFAPPNTITADPVVDSGPPNALHTSKIRAFLAILVLGAIVSVGLAFLSRSAADHRDVVRGGVVG